MKNKKLIIYLGGAGLITVLSLFFFLRGTNVQTYQFDTALAEKGAVSVTVTATGTLEATNTVIVGTQVSGVIEKLYVDFNSVVKKGQVIAELDKSTLKSSLENEEASVMKAQAEFDYQESNLKRMQALFDKKLLAQSDYDAALFDYRKSKASLISAKANYEKAKRNLSYATIYSPIDGVVLNRAVEEGQTVAASMNTPELYTITNDLKEMQVEADVDEADIGMVKEGQRVSFTVDAFPDDTFEGHISEVRLQPTESSNVVTYTVIVSVQNPELKLKPGMTASITDYVKEANNVLVLPGKAVRFQPSREAMKEYMQSLPESERPKRARNKAQGTTKMSGVANGGQRRELAENEKMIWIKEGSSIRPRKIKIGINDGSHVQILSGLSEGDEVVTAMNKVSVKEAKEKTASSPFMPQRPGKGKK